MNCFDCKGEMEQIGDIDAYTCHSCKVIFRNRGYGFEMYEKGNHRLYLEYLKYLEEFENE